MDVFEMECELAQEVEREREEFKSNPRAVHERRVQEYIDHGVEESEANRLATIYEMTILDSDEPVF